jgi:hypothetical protein
VNKIHDPTTALAVRIAVAAVFALLVGCITAVGAYFAGVPEWLIPAVAVLGGVSAQPPIFSFSPGPTFRLTSRANFSRCWRKPNIW